MRMRFDTPERLATLSDNGMGARFPRVGSTRSDLLYRADGAGLRYTPDSSTSPGSNMSSTQPGDSAPLLLLGPIGGLTKEPFNFTFDRADGDAPRALYFARWKTDLAGPELAPMPFNSGSGDYSIAVAQHPGTSAVPRAFWMSNRNLAADLPVPLPTPPMPTLLTALLSADGGVDAVTLTIEQADPPCMPQDDPTKVDPDLTPWVTGDGTRLLLSTTRLDSKCAVSNQKKDIYSVKLDPDSGQPAAGEVASALSDVNSAADDTDPSFSADLCDLYFASNRDGKFGVYRAHRR